MEAGVVFIDTSVLIDYYRKKDKQKSLFFELSATYSTFVVSVITEYEIFIGSQTSEQEKFWNEFFKRVIVLPFDSDVNKTAVKIYRELKAQNKLIDVPDIFIAATAINCNVNFATLNLKHFERIGNIKKLLLR
ncbi:MAG: type II toxin-antitoxin system VapC family toxin [Bacteroidetes bacterium]|nr:type II toxin-antitoxin system VapC family toxin [Bacteroidota bacterium]MBU1717665.1 type II toxin-antitoxin system VapC family toxin [Bacteroidota bacterium]